MTAMAAKKKKPVPARAEGPAVETILHRWNRPATDDQGRPITGKVACSKWTPLEAAYDQGRLGEKGSPEADRRFAAGSAYAKLWDVAQMPGHDSSQALNVTRSFSGGNGSVSGSAAREDITRIHVALSPRDCIIVQMVCGQGFFPSEAVALVSSDYAKATAARFREALDALVEVMAALRN